MEKIPEDAPVIRWDEFMQPGQGLLLELQGAAQGANDPAVILYSGGTTGTTKGILLTNLNFNALGQQIIATNPMFRPGDKMLSAMPLFHGFGLGVCIHSMLSQRRPLHPGARASPRRAMPSSSPSTSCNFIAGVPTLYEALLRLPSMDKRGPELPQGRVLRRRQPVRGAEEEV